MAQSFKKIFKVRKTNHSSLRMSKENLEKLSREELIETILSLETRNIQLKNILNKTKELDRDSNCEAVEEDKKIDFNKVSKRHVLLKFFYLGWNYDGFMTQEHSNNTVEHYLFKALKKCSFIESIETSNYNRCGRTDKEVSGFSQVVSLDLRSKLEKPDETNTSEEFPYCSMLNRLLPENIKCYSWCHVGPNTSARFDCSSRTYKYYFPKGNLNIEAMQEGAKFLIGTHDFRNFCKMDLRNGISEFKRQIVFAEIRPCTYAGAHSSDFEMYEFIIQGNGFLWHQIRCIMTILFLIGQEKESPDIVKQLLNIEENISKPQYGIVSPLPLILYDTKFENTPTKWNINDQGLSRIVSSLQSQWISYYIKCTMLRDLLENLRKLSENPINIHEQYNSLLGEKSKVYKPLLSRMKCQSLECKIENFVKKRKIEIVESADSLPEPH